MLGQAQFYNRTIRKVVVAFGTLFNDIQLQRYSKDGNTKYEIFKVPLSYGPKERYITQITSDPDLTKSINVVVPRISFELISMSYDSSRKLVSTTQNFNYNTTTGLSTQYAPVPYDFNFTMSIYVRNTEDGTQIVEQILPFFTPDWTTSVKLISELDEYKDIPVILNKVSYEDTYDKDFKERRAIIWTMDLLVKGYLYGPIKKSGIIKFVNVNFYTPSVPDGKLSDAVGNTAIAEKMTVQPGLTANGEPTSNLDLTIPYSQIEADDNYGYIIKIYNEDEIF